MNPEIILMGTATVDTIYTRRGRTTEFGGMPYFGSKMLDVLGIRYAVVCNATDKLRRELNKSNFIQMDGIHSSRKIPEIEIREFDGPTAKLKSLPRGFKAPGLPRRFLSSKAIVVSTIGSEISSNSLKQIKSRAMGMVCVDLQGYTRPEEKLRSGSYMTESEKRMPRDWTKIARCIDVVKVNRYELDAIAKGQKSLLGKLKLVSRAGPKVVLATFGKRGAAVFYKGNVTRTKPYTNISKEHSVGAGDSSFVLFIAMLVSGKTPPEALKAATELFIKYLEQDRSVKL